MSGTEVRLHRPDSVVNCCVCRSGEDLKGCGSGSDMVISGDVHRQNAVCQEVNQGANRDRSHRCPKNLKENGMELIEFDTAPLRT